MTKNTTPDPHHNSSPTPARKRAEYLIPLIVACTFFMQILDSAIINTSLPQMAASFHVDTLDISIGITVYMLFAAAFVPLSGWLADRFGSRRIFLLAIFVFSLASLFCGIAQNLWQFVIARAFQGMGGALMTPVGRMVVLRNTEKANLLQATALITWPGLLAPVIGPVVGGFITTYFSWHWNFLLNVPLGIVGMWLVRRHIPNMFGEKTTPLDWKGFFLSGAALATMLYGLESLAHNSHPWQISLTLIVLGCALGYLAIRHFRVAEHPLLSLASFQIPTFSILSLSSGAVMRICIAATPFLLPLLLQVGLGMTPLDAGTYVLIYFLGNIGIKPLTSPILRRWGFRTVLIWNGALVATSILLCGLISQSTPHWLMLVLFLIAGSTRSMQFTSMNTLIFADVPPKNVSAASTLSNMTMQICLVLGVTLAAMLLNLSQWLRHGQTLELADFSLPFIVIGLAGLIACWRFRTIPLNAGAELTHSTK